MVLTTLLGPQSLFDSFLRPQLTVTLIMIKLVTVTFSLLVLLPRQGATELVSSPLWSTSDNVSNTCFITFSGDQDVVFHGSSINLCSLQISTDASLKVHISGNLTEDYRLYAERHDLPDTCAGKHVSIHGRANECRTNLFSGSITLHLKGNISVVISETPQQQSVSSQCPDTNYSHRDSTLPSCQVSNYTDLLTCEYQSNVSCRFTFPPNCTATLLFEEVVLSCNDSKVQVQNAIIVYPHLLIQLNLTSKHIVEIDVRAFRNFNQVQYIYLDFNKIETLKSGVFSGLINLVHLSLQGNSLITLEPDLLTDLQKLSVLDLSYNQLTSIDHSVFQTLTNLKDLLLNDNILHTLDASAFRGLTSLEYLTLSDNDLVSLHEDVFANLTNLYNLVLGDNKIVTLDNPYLFRDLGKLYKLHLGRNGLATIHSDLLRNLSNLHELRLFHNAVKHYPSRVFKQMKYLRVLSIYNNGFTTLPSDLFDDLINIEELNIGKNKVEEFPPNIFRNIVKLRTLYLDQNQLNNIQEDLFASLTSLNRLTLNLNNLRRIESDVFLKTKNLTDLDLSDNRLVSVPNFSNLHQLNFLKIQHNELVNVNGKSFSGLSERANLYVSQHEICECYVDKKVNCTGSGTRSPYLTCDRLLSDRVLVAMMWLIGLNALGGNAFVLYYTNRYNRSKTQCFLLSNLALSDLLMGLYMVLIAITDIYFGEGFPMRAETWRTGPTCKFAGALSIISSESSVFFVTLISVDRFFSIKYPHSSLRLNRVSIKVVGAILWTIALVLGIVPSVLAGRNPDFYDNSHVCIGLPLAVTELYTTQTSVKRIESKYRPISVEITRSIPSGEVSHMYFSTAVFLGLNCCCYLLVAMCYISIMRTVYQSSKRVNLNKEMKVQIRLTFKVAAIVATDFLCWFPIIILGILVQSGSLTLPPSVFAWAITFVLPINSAINPYLYTIADVISKRRKRLVGDAGSAVDSRTDMPAQDTGQERSKSNTGSTFIVVKPSADTVRVGSEDNQNSNV